MEEQEEHTSAALSAAFASSGLIPFHDDLSSCRIGWSRHCAGQVVQRDGRLADRDAQVSE